MPKKKNNMKLTSVVQAWLDKLGWTDKIVIDEELQSSRLNTGFNQNGQTFSVWVDVNEKRNLIDVYVYGEIEIPESRYDEACKLVNGINSKIPVGRICALKGKNFQYKASIDIGNGVLEPMMIEDMLAWGLEVFRAWNTELTKVATSNTSADMIFEESEREENEG